MKNYRLHNISLYSITSSFQHFEQVFYSRDTSVTQNFKELISLLSIHPSKNYTSKVKNYVKTLLQEALFYNQLSYKNSPIYHPFHFCLCSPSYYCFYIMDKPINDIPYFLYILPFWPSNGQRAQEKKMQIKKPHLRTSQATLMPKSSSN